jgi:hypothetical protein
MRIIFPAALVTAMLALMPFASAEGRVCAVYITGIGCPNCAVTDPEVTSGFTGQNPDCLVIEYEIYQKNADNYPAAEGYFSSYVAPGMPHGVPFLVLGGGSSYVGRFEVLEARSVIGNLSSSGCPMPDGSSVDFGSLDMAALPGKPNIWARERVLVPEGGGGDNGLLRELLFEDDIRGLLGSLGYEEVLPVPVRLSGSQVEFEHAVRLDGWLFQWNDEGPDGNGPGGNKPGNGGGNSEENAASLYSIAAVLIIMVAGLLVYFTRLR